MQIWIFGKHLKIWKTNEKIGKQIENFEKKTLEIQKNLEIWKKKLENLKLTIG